MPCGMASFKKNTGLHGASLTLSQFAESEISSSGTHERHGSDSSGPDNNADHLGGERSRDPLALAALAGDQPGGG